jgi:hypothetical protein
MTMARFNMHQIRENLKYLATHIAGVGVVNSTGPDQEGKVSVAQYAYWNEFGTKDIPARPFIRSYPLKEKEALARLQENLYKQVLHGTMSGEEALTEYGSRVQDGIKDNIVDGYYVPNSPETIERKKSDRPLIDKGAMRESIRVTISERGIDEYS